MVGRILPPSLPSFPSSSFLPFSPSFLLYSFLSSLPSFLCCILYDLSLTPGSARRVSLSCSLRPSPPSPLPSPLRAFLGGRGRSSSLGTGDPQAWRGVGVKAQRAAPQPCAPRRKGRRVAGAVAQVRLLPLHRVAEKCPRGINAGINCVERRGGPDTLTFGEYYQRIYRGKIEMTQYNIRRSLEKRVHANLPIKRVTESRGSNLRNRSLLTEISHLFIQPLFTGHPLCHAPREMLRITTDA